jgi:hypothetical protein
MAQMFKNCFQTGSRWPVVVGFSLLVVLSATGIVAASPSWSHHIASGVATASYKVVIAAYHRSATTANDSGDSDYLQGLAKAVPGLVRH